ncbi:MAG: FMN-binding protein [Candidatus Saccharimonadales bacterium]
MISRLILGGLSGSLGYTAFMKYFKQILLAAFVVGAYLLYSFHQRGENDAVIGAPSSGGGAASPGAVTAAPVRYRDGSYTGGAASAFYGDIQVRTTVAGGKITDVKFLRYPNDRLQSIRINTQAMPMLKQEAISVQSANVDVITGATDTSDAFIQSLGSALALAK